MKGYSTLTWFLRGCLLQLVPLFLQAQVDPNLPMPTPPQMRGRIPPPLVPPPGPVGIDNKPVPPLSKDSLETDSLETDRISDVLDFWFGRLPGPDFFPDDKMSIWFA